MTDGECYCGYVLEHYEEFLDVIEDSFRQLLKAQDRKKFHWSDPDISELWQSALGQRNPQDDEYIYLDGPLLISLMSRLLKDAGAAAHVWENDAPLPLGCSEISDLHAEDPKVVFEAAITKLKQLLSACSVKKNLPQSGRNLALHASDYHRFLVHVHSDIFDLVTHSSCLLGGKLIRIDAWLSLKVKCHSPADLPMLSRGSVLLGTLQQLLPSAAVAKRSPAQCSAAEAAPHPASAF